jgi:hypothetical protein
MRRERAGHPFSIEHVLPTQRYLSLSMLSTDRELAILCRFITEEEHQLSMSSSP